MEVGYTTFSCFWCSTVEPHENIHELDWVTPSGRGKKSERPYYLTHDGAAWDVFLHSYWLDIFLFRRVQLCFFSNQVLQNSGDTQWLLAELVREKITNYPWGSCRREQASFFSSTSGGSLGPQEVRTPFDLKGQAHVLPTLTEQRKDP